ncbi:hypothetical protein IWW37_004253 [Coemansia sp. RSA 2050]|nr:hypothetical protein IWW37_004253 [Coemansia sp. RSA 2050]KAJ2731576.1 hypothetical protein IW152_004444 [Coemansia sp. BCRC 34962]
MLAAADPVQLLTNYPSWKEQLSARQSSMISNYKDIYSFVSTGLPLLESGVLGILGGISNIGRIAESKDDDALQSELDNMIRAYTALISLAADRRHIPLLASTIEPQDAWMPPTDAAPVAFANAPETNQLQANQLQANQIQESPAVVAPTTGNARADRDAREARREERRKEWQEWARQQDENGVSNGSNFIGQILSGVSGIVDSALGPVYSLIGQ